MHSLYTFSTPTRSCSYLPAEQATLEYELVASMSAEEYLRRMLDGWRRFGHMLFHPACRVCRACRPLRIDVARFRPDRSQRRALRDNADVELHIVAPCVTGDNLDLYDRYHAFQVDEKGWPVHAPKSPADYAQSFVHHPFEVEEWNYRLGDQLIGVGYVDPLVHAPPDLPGQEGLSAIYFFWEPEERRRGLGTFNVMSLVAEARRRRLPWVYLGYYVAGSPSMEYKPRFVPNEMRGDDGVWRPFRE